MLYLHVSLPRLALKLFRGEPAISYLRVRLEFLPYPHLIPTLFNGCGFGPPLPFTAASTWTWIGHPVSGLRIPTLALLRLGFPTAPQLVNTGFQVLFHSPPGVLFTFPSQYYALSVTKEYLALRGGPRSFSQGFSCLDLLWIPLCLLSFPVRGFHPLRLAFPKPFR